MRYAPLYSEIADSSLWDEPYHVRILFVTMMAKKQADQIVYGDEYRLKKWANLNSMEEVNDALRVLESPDKLRPGQRFQGRRIERVDGGWLILNGEKYEELMQKINERARKAQWARENRKKAKQNRGGGPLPGETAYVKAKHDGNEEEAQRLLDNQHRKNGEPL